MTDVSKVMIYVDKNDVAPSDVTRYVNENFDGDKTLKMLGLSRLAGKYQVQGKKDDHRELIRILDREYWRF